MYYISLHGDFDKATALKCVTIDMALVKAEHLSTRPSPGTEGIFDLYAVWSAKGSVVAMAYRGKAKWVKPCGCGVGCPECLDSGYVETGADRG